MKVSLLPLAFAALLFQKLYLRRYSSRKMVKMSTDKCVTWSNVWNSFLLFKFWIQKACKVLVAIFKSIYDIIDFAHFVRQGKHYESSIRTLRNYHKGKDHSECTQCRCFASSLARSMKRLETVCPALSSMKDETSQSTNEHSEFLNFGLHVFKGSVSDVTALIGDNCSTTNRSVATELNESLIGRASHRSRLSVWEASAKEENLISKVRDLIVKLRISLLLAKLSLCWVQSCPTRHTGRLCTACWKGMCLYNSTCANWVTKTYLTKNLDDLVLSAASEHRIDTLSGKNFELNVVGLKLWTEHCGLRQGLPYLILYSTFIPTWKPDFIKVLVLCTALALNLELSRFRTCGWMIRLPWKSLRCEICF